MIDLPRFALTHGSLTRTEFLDRVSVPHLLVAEFAVSPTRGFRTTKLEKRDLFAPGGGAKKNYFVVSLSKREGSNAFTSMITFGRAKNNDLVFEHDRVSKFHGYFTQKDGGWHACHANSENGITVDGVEVPADGSLPLTSGAQITLGGKVELVFYLPEQLHARCQAELRNS